MDHRYGSNSHFMACLEEHLKTEGLSTEAMPPLGGFEVDLYMLSKAVAAEGGLQEVINHRRWSAIADKLKIPVSAGGGTGRRDEKLQGYYYKFLLSYDLLSQTEKKQIETRVLQTRASRRQKGEVGNDEFGFETGKVHSLVSFKQYADDFKGAWFKGQVSKTSQVHPNLVESEFWKIIDDADRHVCVSYGSDIDTTKHGSGFSINKPSDPYSKFGWNLNVLPGLEGSILKYIKGISGISMPWLYVGMVFSAFCWHNEDNYLASINYHHFGDPKVWYGVPGADAKRLEAVFKKLMPEEFERHPLLLHDLVTMLSPERLTKEGVRVCRTVQEKGHFVVTFPQAYHSGFSTGFNCGEAVNFAAASWIPFGLRAVEDYARQRRPVSLDQEQLLLRTAQKERNRRTLMMTLPELQYLRKREQESRTR